MSSSGLSDYEGGMSAFGGADGETLFTPTNMKMAGLGLVIVYLLWFVWKNWTILSGWLRGGVEMGYLALNLAQYNPFSTTEGMSAGLKASYAMATNPGGTAKYLVTGDSLNNSAGWLANDYADLSNLRGREGMWTGREGMSNVDIHRDGFQSGEAPQFWEPNQYLTEARQYGIPDLSSNFKEGSANRVYYGREGLTQGQLHNIMNN